VPIDSVVGTKALFVRDHSAGNNLSVQISFMAAPPGEPIFDAAVRTILMNVQNKDKGATFLSVTGPAMFGKLFEQIHPLYKFKFQQHTNRHLAALDGTLVIEKMMLPGGIQSGSYADMWFKDKVFDTQITRPVEDWSDPWISILKQL